MRVVYQHVAGLEVHKKVLVVTIIIQQEDRSWHQAKRSFWTMTIAYCPFPIG